MAARGAMKPAVRRDAMRSSTMKSGRGPLAIAFLSAEIAVTHAATQQAEAPDLTAIAGSLPPPPAHIGRASSRGRVGQYVYVTGVAESLKIQCTHGELNVKKTY